ncbi:MAG: PAS domain S-box protein, partial [Mariprofundaceae bacterium]
YSQEELLGKNHRILKSDYHSDAFYKQMWRTIASGKAWHGEIKNRAKSGKSYWVDSTIVPFLNAQGKPYKYVAIRTDITTRKETEETHKKLTAAFYYAAEALMITDSTGLVEHVNPAFEEMTGYLDVEIQGRPETMLRSSEHDESFYENINKALHKGEVWKGELVLLCKDRSKKTTLRSLAPVLNEKGEMINYVTIMTDITEDSLLRSKMEHAQRLESLGVLAGGIAHDFNNILTSIMGNARLAEIKLAEVKMTDEKRESFPYLKRISTASERAADLCRQMLAYSGQGNVEMRSINLSELVDEITTLLEVSVADKTSIHYHLATRLSAIHADTGQLQQVVMNLITNARESYPEEKGEVWVDVGDMHADKNWISTCVVGDDIDEGEYVYVEVKDSGSGMDKATMAKIFDPFFTTKFTGRGLGMSAMMGIVKAHHGAIHIYSEPGEGTMIRVVFPAVDIQVEPLAGDVLEVGEHSKAFIMIVDDETDILEYAKAILTDLGHDVITAISGEQALEMFQQEELRIGLVITDATMPGMSGDQLCQQLHAIDKDVKLILSSGYDANDLTQGIQSELLSGFIQKPYSPEKFTHEVFKVLEG